MGAAALFALAGAEVLSIALARRSPSRVVPAAAAVSAVLFGVWWAVGLVAPARRRGRWSTCTSPRSAARSSPASGRWSTSGSTPTRAPRRGPHRHRRDRGRRRRRRARVGRLAALPLAAAAACSVVLGAARGRGAAPRPLRRRDAPPAAGRARPRRSRAADPAAQPVPAQIALVVGPRGVRRGARRLPVQGPGDRALRRRRRLLGAFAAFHTAMGVASLLPAGDAEPRALRQLGIAGTLALRPAAHRGGALAAALAAPGFATATLARGAHESLTNSLFRSGLRAALHARARGREAPRQGGGGRRRSTRSAAFVGSGAVALALAFVPARAESLLFAFAVAALAGRARAVSRPLHRGYVRTLEKSLLQGRVRLDAADVVDHATQVTLAHTGLIDRDDAPAPDRGAPRRGQADSLIAPASASLRAGSSLARASALDGPRAGVGCSRASPKLVRRALRAAPRTDARPRGLAASLCSPRTL